MKRVIDFIAGLFVGGFIAGFFWVMVWLSNFLAMNVYFIIFVATTILTFAVADFD